MIASFPMYDRRETRGAYNRLWRAIRTEITPAWSQHFPNDTLPETLSQDVPAWDGWRAPDLVLGQTCGLPYRSALHDNVVLITTPDYGLANCRPGHYNSIFVMAADKARENPEDWQNLRLAANSECSQSGWAAPVSFMSDRGLAFADITFTGAHRLSARAVLEGTADIAALDAQTWRMIRRWDRWSDALVEVGHTDDTPGLPFIAAPAFERLALPQAIERAYARLSPEDIDQLDLKGVVRVPSEAYLSVKTPTVFVK